MVVTTTVLVYFVDLLPHVVDTAAGIASDNNASISSNEVGSSRQLALKSGVPFSCIKHG